MIHGSMMEAEQGFATLEDVDVNTFVRFVQWLYYGYYDAASPRSLASLDTYQSPVRVTQKAKTCNSCHRTTYDAIPQPNESFVQRSYTVRNVKKDAPQPRPNSNKPEDYSEVFLGHARLYVFAEKYDLQILKTLALEELHATLAVYTLYQERTGDIVALLHYVYTNTAESKSGVEDLRTLLSQYMETEADTLVKAKDLQNLMIQDGGPLLADLMKVISEKQA